MRRRERIYQAIAACLCLLFVFTLRDSGPKYVTSARIVPPPVPESVTERPGRVSVWVEGEGAQPVGGASVRILSMQEESAYLAGAARTDPSGRAELASLPKGEAWLLAEAEGFARASTRLVVDETAREVKVRLRQAGALRVAVVDDGGAAIAGAWVEARTGDPLPFVTRTDAGGQAALLRLGPPPWNLRVDGAGFERATQTVVKSSTDAIKITLRKLGNIEVTTVDSEGRPLGDAVVIAAGSGLWPARQVDTDPQGRATISDLPRGIYDLRAIRGELVSPAEMGIALGRGGSKALTLALAKGRRVSVRVTDGEEEGAAPVSAASVVLVEGGLSSFPIEATTDKSGAVSVGPIAPGDAYVSARADGFVPRTGVPVPSAQSPVVRIGLWRGATLRGDVVDARGFPVDGARIEVVGTAISGEPIDESPERSAFRAAHFSWALGGPRPLVTAGQLGVMPGPLPPVPHAGAPLASFVHAGSTSPPEPWVTRDDGTFRAFPVPPGRVRAIVHHPSYIQAVSEVALLAPGGETRVRVVMRAGGTLEGRVLDDRRTAMAGARVEIVASKGALERTTLTADDGTFAFAAVPGDIIVSASRPDSLDDVALRTNVSIREGERKEIEIVLPPARESMTIVVADEHGIPLDGAQVVVSSLEPDAPLRRTLFSDREGQAVFKGVAGLPLRISVERKGRAPEVRELEAAPSDLRIELKGGVSVAGVVTSRRGRDRLEGAEVTLYTTVGPRRARTDRDGAYRFDDVPPGSAQLAATRAGYARVERSVSIESSAHSDRPISLESVDLEEGGSVEGEVLDANGDPVAGARVAAGGVPTAAGAAKMPDGVVLTNRRGEFKLDGLAEGNVIIEAYAPEAGRGRATGVHVTPGRATGRVRISLVPSPEGEP